MSAPRVLHLINGEYFGGSARVLLNYLAASARQADVAVGVFFRGELERRLEAMEVPVAQIAMRGRMDLSAARQVVRLARRHRADIVHTHQVRNTLVGRVAARVDGRPVVTHLHSPAFRESTSGMRNRLTGGIDRALAGWTRRFIAVSDSLAREAVRVGIRSERIRVVPNGVPLPPIADATVREDVRAELGLAPDAELVGMVANFRPRKGTEVLIEAMALGVGPTTAAHLLLVGEPFREPGRDYGRELAALVATRNLSPRTTMTGFRSDPERLMAALDVLVLPSLFGEGLPMVLLEAMGAGVPVVSTPVEGIVELVRDGETGRLVAPDDPAALGQAIAWVLEDPVRRRALGAAARETIIAGYTDERMATGIEAVYAELRAMADRP